MRRRPRAHPPRSHTRHAHTSRRPGLARACRCGIVLPLDPILWDADTQLDPTTNRPLPKPSQGMLANYTSVQLFANDLFVPGRCGDPPCIARSGGGCALRGAACWARAQLCVCCARMVQCHRAPLTPPPSPPLRATAQPNHHHQLAGQLHRGVWQPQRAADCRGADQSVRPVMAEQCVASGCAQAQPRGEQCWVPPARGGWSLHPSRSQECHWRRVSRAVPLPACLPTRPQAQTTVASSVKLPCYRTDTFTGKPVLPSLDGVPYFGGDLAWNQVRG